jgi:hypothetical protein
MLRSSKRESEDFVTAVLPEKGFELACPYPSWPHRGVFLFLRAVRVR